MFYSVGDRVVVPGDAEDGVVAPEAVQLSEALDKALRYLAPSMFNALPSLV